jgi:Ca2+-binding RTX toxin-like protein
VSTTVSISGSGQVDVTVFGQGTVYAGNGNDNINITGSGSIVVGSGNDTLTLGQGGTITEHGASGHDTIQIGPTGSYTISEEGHATVTGAFGTATIDGGVLNIVEGANGTQTTSAGATGSTHGTTTGTTGLAHVTHMHGPSTLLGSAHTTEFASGHAGLAFMKAGMGQDSLVGGSTHNIVALHDKAGPALIKNFVAGHDHLYLPGHSLVFAAQTHAISTQGDKTMIGMDGGKTMIELHGVHVDKH